MFLALIISPLGFIPSAEVKLSQCSFTLLVLTYHNWFTFPNGRDCLADLDFLKFRQVQTSLYSFWWWKSFFAVICNRPSQLKRSTVLSFSMPLCAACLPLVTVQYHNIIVESTRIVSACPLKHSLPTTQLLLVFWCVSGSDYLNRNKKFIIPSEFQMAADYSSFMNDNPTPLPPPNNNPSLLLYIYWHPFCFQDLPFIICTVFL